MLRTEDIMKHVADVGVTQCDASSFNRPSGTPLFVVVVVVPTDESVGWSLEIRNSAD
jgi:hypothetical protein